MTITGALEHHAERGTVRGPTAIWAEAVRESARGEPSKPGRDHRPQRVLVWAAVILVAILGLAALRRFEVGGSVETSPVAEQVANEAGQEESDADELPPPLLIDGMDLVHVFAPSDMFQPPDRGDATRVQVFAEASDPTVGPILGVKHLPGGGFQPWGVNLGDRTLDSLTEGLERVGDDWRPDPSMALTEVADLTTDPFAMADFEWQLDFEGDDRLAHIRSDPGSVWLWIARSADSAGGRLISWELEPVTVGSRIDGLAMIPTDMEDQRGVDVIWEADGWVNRLGLSRIEGDVAFGDDARSVAADVVVVERAQWLAEIEATGRLTPGRVASAMAILVLAAAWVVGMARLLGPRFGTLRVVTAAVVGGVGFVLLVALSGQLVAAVLGLAVGVVVVLTRRLLGSRLRGGLRRSLAWVRLRGRR